MTCLSESSVISDTFGSMKSPKKQNPSVRLAWNGRRDQPDATAAALNPWCEIYPSQVDKAIDNTPSRLILGDNLSIMSALLPELAGKIDLIYVDPPFLTGKTYAARIGRNEDSRRPSEWKTTKGYQDTWPDLGAYLDMLYPRLCLMHQLLAPTGTLYLHLDWHASAYARVLLDEIFGTDRLLNEIVWIYHGPSPIRSAFNRKHDTILVYTKSRDNYFDADAVRVAYNPLTHKTFASSKKAGFGKIPDLKRGKVPEDWWYFPVVARLHKERTGYPTQKPEGLLKRIILASSKPGDLVADFFSGSGTTAVMADRLGRRWLACDQSQLAIQTTYRRMLLEPLRQPIQLLVVEGLEPENELKINVSITRKGSEAKVELLGLDSIHPPEARAELMEIDWLYNGNLFRSMSYSALGWRKEGGLTTLSYTYPSAGSYPICIQVCDHLGRLGRLLETIEI